MNQPKPEPAWKREPFGVPFPTSEYAPTREIKPRPVEQQDPSK